MSANDYGFVNKDQSLPEATTTVSIPGESKGNITIELNSKTPDTVKVIISNSYTERGGLADKREESILISRRAFDTLFRAVSSYGQHYKPNNR